MKRNATIDDVARAAGVARVTVSRVLNNVENVRAETRDRVLRAVDSLGYSVNHQARALATGSSRQVMLVHAHDPEREPNSYYHAGLELGALRACSSLRFDLITRSVDPQAGDPWRLLAPLVDRERPLGLILSPPLSDDVELLRSLRLAKVSAVAISAGDGARELASTVGIDEREGGRTIGRHLVELGHRRIGFVKGPPAHRAAALRFDGFVDALIESGFAGPAWAGQGDFTFRSGAEAAETLLRENANVTALACANDDMAAGAMLALHRAGLEIPSAISVTGFDDTPMSEIIWPPLTTIRQPIKDLAERGVRLLIEATVEVQREEVPHSLVVRESTAPPNRLRSA